MKRMLLSFHVSRAQNTNNQFLVRKYNCGNYQELENVSTKKVNDCVFSNYRYVLF